MAVFHDRREQYRNIVAVSMCNCACNSNFALFAYNPLSQHSDRKFGERTINCIAVHYPKSIFLQRKTLRDNNSGSVHTCLQCPVTEHSALSHQRRLHRAAYTSQAWREGFLNRRT